MFLTLPSLSSSVFRVHAQRFFYSHVESCHYSYPTSCCALHQNWCCSAQLSASWFKLVLLLLLLLLLLSSSLSSSPLCSVFTLIFLTQTVSLGNTVLQLFCCYYSWCLYRQFQCSIYCTFTSVLSAVCVCSAQYGCFL